MNAVAARFCADVDHGIANAFGFGQKNFFLFSDAEREGVDERILRIARLEADFATDGGHTKAISVAPDSANYAVEDAAVFCSVLFAGVLACTGLSEAQSNQHGGGARPPSETCPADPHH